MVVFTVIGGIVVINALLGVVVYGVDAIPF